MTSDAEQSGSHSRSLVLPVTLGAVGVIGLGLGTVFGAKVSSVAWKSKPSWYVLSTNDRMIQPDLQRRFAKDINARTTSIPSSHVPMLSHPAAVAQVIIEAARTARSH